MASPPPTGLLPSEVIALREAAGVPAEGFAQAFGVSPNVVERWEQFGVPTGPTALAIRLVADSMEFEFPEPETDPETPCELCGAPAAEQFSGVPVCMSCHRDPVKSMEAIGYVITKSHNPVSRDTSYEVHLPSDRQFGYSGRFLSEGLGTLLTKLFKDEPQLGEKQWDDAVYVQWVEPDLNAIGDQTNRDLLRTLVAFGMIDIEPDTLSVSNAPAWSYFDEEIILLCGLLASRST